MALHPIRHSSPLNLQTGIVAILIVIVIAYFLFSGSSVQKISSNKTVSLLVNSSFNFNLPDNTTPASIFLASSSNNSATIYLSTLPVLEKNLYQITLQRGSSINVSVYNSPNADLQIGFVAGGLKSGSISLIYIPSNLNVKPAALQALNSTSFGKGGATTTISQSTQTTTIKGTTTTAPTTTVKSQNVTQQALIDANNSIEGTLIVNYNRLYTTAAAKCTPSAYNTTYITKHSHAPSGPNSFANVTLAVPTSLYETATKAAGNVYNVTYTAVIPIGNLPALKMQINTTTQFVGTYSFVGIFQGETYDTALSQYQGLNQSTNPCSPYVP